MTEFRLSINHKIVFSFCFCFYSPELMVLGRKRKVKTIYNSFFYVLKIKMYIHSNIIMLTLILTLRHSLPLPFEMFLKISQARIFSQKNTDYLVIDSSLPKTDYCVSSRACFHKNYITSSSTTLGIHFTRRKCHH